MKYWRHDHCPDCGGIKDKRSVRCQTCKFLANPARTSRCADCDTKIHYRFTRCRPCADRAKQTGTRHLSRCIDCGKERMGRPGTRCRQCDSVAKTGKQLPRRPVEDRFWAFVKKTDACWLWIGTTNGSGYGRFALTRTKKIGAHRFAYELLVGPVPDHLDLDHLCRNRACVNPAHLEPVTRAENLRRGREAGSFVCPMDAVDESAGMKDEAA